MSVVNCHVAAVWLPEGDRRVIQLELETEAEVYPPVVMTEKSAAWLVSQLLSGIHAAQKLPRCQGLETRARPSGPAQNGQGEGI